MNFHEAFFEEFEKIGQEPGWLVTPRQGGIEAILRFGEPVIDRIGRISTTQGILKRFGMPRTDPQFIDLSRQKVGDVGLLRRLGKTFGPSLAIPAGGR